MMKFLILLLIVLVAHSYLAITTKAQQCKPSGGLRGKAPPGECNTENDSECCNRGQIYPTFECSPPFTNGKAKARLTLNSFQAGGDGGGASKCVGKFHSDSTPVVALSSGWLQEDGADRCNKNIRITAPSGKSVVARVVDECDSTAGCDDEHSFQPPCANNIVDGSRAVWDALGIPRDEQGDLNVIWSDA